jgi:uncharacterized protein YydD (DUF2326 family)
LNVILGEIRLPENKNKDTHNLGKSKLMEIIDYCFLKEREQTFFLFKHFDEFEGFVFFLEIKLNSGRYLTVRRSVAANTKISIKRHNEKYQDYNHLPKGGWDYFDLPIKKAKLILDAEFNLKSIDPWDYRAAINYALRNQGDFSDVFKLSNFLGRHLHWKPYIGKILGFNSDNLIKNYELTFDIEKAREGLTDLRLSIGSIEGNEEEVLTGLLEVKHEEADSLQSQLDTFNFDEADKDNIRDLVNELDGDIYELNRAKYYLTANIKKLRSTIEARNVDFNVPLIKKLFDECGVYFEGQIKKSYDELIEFNKKITTERQKYVSKKIEELEVECQNILISLRRMNETRSQRLSYLNTIGAFDKYKEVTTVLLSINTEINDINRRLTLSEEINRIEVVMASDIAEQLGVQSAIREDRDSVTKAESGIYQLVKTMFADFVDTVLDKRGFISTKQNGEGNLEFFAGIMKGSGKQTSESDGHSYKKILCMGYDLSLNFAYHDKDFVRFIYHDGGLETLDDRKKNSFIEYVRNMPIIFGTQYILTVIDTDLPTGFKFTEDEVVLTLHDDGDNGLLFKMPSW